MKQVRKPADPLLRVRRARAALEAAKLEYSAAVVAARRTGLSFDAIAAAAGVTRQAARQLVLREEER